MVVEHGLDLGGHHIDTHIDHHFDSHDHHHGELSHDAVDSISSDTELAAMNPSIQACNHSFDQSFDQSFDRTIGANHFTGNIHGSVGSNGVDLSGTLGAEHHGSNLDIGGSVSCNDHNGRINCGGSGHVGWHGDNGAKIDIGASHAPGGGWSGGISGSFPF